jgi:CheY-like chemotaxis protein
MSIYGSSHRPKNKLMESLKYILLVEDDPKDVELTLSALGEHSLANRVVVVRDGVEALDYLYRRGAFMKRPDGNPVMILLDLKMPRVDGLQVVRQLKADEPTRLVPIVILTSSREPRDLMEGYRLGINAYVVKPLCFTEFVEAIKHIAVFWGQVNEPPPAGGTNPMSASPEPTSGPIRRVGKPSAGGAGQSIT